MMFLDLDSEASIDVSTVFSRQGRGWKEKQEEDHVPIPLVVSLGQEVTIATAYLVIISLYLKWATERNTCKANNHDC